MTLVFYSVSDENVVYIDSSMGIISCSSSEIYIDPIVKVYGPGIWPFQPQSIYQVALYLNQIATNPFRRGSMHMLWN